MKRQYTISQLKQVYQWAKKNPNQEIKIDYGEYFTGSQWLRWFHEKLNEKCSRGLSRIGRKWSYEWQLEAYRTAQAVNNPRLIIRWLPLEFRARFAHRLYSD